MSVLSEKCTISVKDADGCQIGHHGQTASIQSMTWTGVVFRRTCQSETKTGRPVFSARSKTWTGIECMSIRQRYRMFKDLDGLDDFSVKIKSRCGVSGSDLSFKDTDKCRVHADFSVRIRN